MSVNTVALAAISFIQMVLGGIWYGPLFASLFVKYHLKGVQPKGSQNLALMSSLIAAVILSFSLMLVHAFVDPGTLTEAIQAGLFCELLLLGGALMHSFFEGKHVVVLLLHEAFHTLSFTLNSYVLFTFFRKH